MTRRLLLFLTLGAGIATGGCVGAISGQAIPGGDGTPGTGPGTGPGGGGSGSGPQTGSPSVPPGPIDLNAPATDSVSAAWTRRLTKTEMGNAVADLTGVRPAAIATLPDEATDLDFDRVAQTQTVVDRHIQGYLAMGDQVVAAIADGGLPALAGSTTTCRTIDRACAQAIANVLGKRAFRRAPTSEQMALMLGLFDGAATPRDGVNNVIRFILQSPSFVYVLERGTPVSGQPGVVALDDYEIATRLSLLACETLPDAQLLAAADAGQLHEPAQIAAQAQRVFGLPCAHATAQRFFTQWFKLDRVATIMPDTAVFPQFTPAVRQAMIDEDRQFFDNLVWTANAPLQQLFTADYSFVDQRLAPFYGVTATGTTPMKVTMPPARRGILTHASVLTILSNPTATSPVRRGVYVYKKILCQDIAPPPPTLDTTPPKDDPTKTTRQRYELRTLTGVCGSCHSLFMPIGFALENFDPIGRERDTDNGQPVDATGGLPTFGVAGLDGGASLSTAVADRDEMLLCFARKYLRFGLGRNESQADVTSIKPLVELARNKTAMRDMLVALSKTYAFTHRAIPTESGGQP